MSAAIHGSCVGLLFGLGTLLVVIGVPVSRRPDLLTRLEPYIDDSPSPARLFGLRRHEELTMHHVLGPAARRAGRWLGRVLGGESQLNRRLERAGLPADAEGFRAQQALWAVAGAVGGVALASLAVVARGVSPLIVPAMLMTGGMLGLVSRDQLLTRAIGERERRMLMEFPALAELLALSVAAGEGAGPALARVTRLAQGALADEFRVALADVRSGETLTQALEGVADRTGLGSVARFVDGIVVAVERGTPLADVMRAQAQDAREAAKQTLIEEGGKREIAMLVPVVFFVLPVTIVFAVFPGLAAMELAL